jgi:hypothetical protein
MRTARREPPCEYTYSLLVAFRNLVSKLA